MLVSRSDMLKLLLFNSCASTTRVAVPIEGHVKRIGGKPLGMKAWPERPTFNRPQRKKRSPAQTKLWYLAQTDSSINDPQNWAPFVLFEG